MASRMGPHGNRRNAGHRLKTDADLGGATAQSGRQLQRWIDEDASTVPADELADMSLESAAAEGKSWDQFAANKEKFGIVPTYDERYYTTEIDKSHPEYAAREQRARQLAIEIESQAHDGNVHLAEERGARIDDSGFDEEDRFSGVARAKNHRAFAAEEARKSMADPKYLQDKEQAERAEDRRRLDSRKPRSRNSPTRNSTSKLPAAGAPATTGAATTTEKSGGNESNDAKSKKKFNFAAAAAKASAFQSSLSPSPRNSFSPVSVPSPPGVNSPNMVPPMMSIPSAPPFVFSPSPAPGMPGMGPPPPPFVPGMGPGPGPIGFQFGLSPYGSSGPESADELSRSASAVDLSSIKELGDAFDYIKHLEHESQTVPKMYTTAPTWTTTSTVSYVDQFPMATIAPRMPSFASPVGFMYPPQF